MGVIQLPGHHLVSFAPHRTAYQGFLFWEIRDHGHGHVSVAIDVRPLANFMTFVLREQSPPRNRTQSFAEVLRERNNSIDRNRIMTEATYRRSGMIGRFRIVVTVQCVIELALAKSAGRWASQRGGMGAGEGVDDFGERAEVKVE
jgi:hypothetical protein